MSVCETDISIPSYLRKPDVSDRFYGTLSYEQETKSWIITGEPCVIEMAKRLFPGCNGRGGGIARFKSSKRINGDLNWLMLRYPLKIEEPKRWGLAFQETVEHVVKRERIFRSPQKVQPLHFNGKLTPFQEEGLAFLLHNRKCLLADDMGLGKTVQALAFLSTLQAYPALLVVPAHLILNWTKEMERFIRPPVPIGKNLTLFDELGESVHVIKGRKLYELPPASIYIIHYHLLAWWKDELAENVFEAVIFDEIQDLRHAGTQKYSAASLLSDQCQNVIGLSGTPIYNKGGEIWNVMNIIEFHCLGDWESFTREWCSGYGSMIVEKSDLLGDYLKREGLLLRRTKDQVLTELPPKRRVVQTIDFEADKYGNLIQSAIELAKRMDDVKDHLERGRMTRKIVNTARQAAGIAKAPFVAQFVKLLLDAGEKVLLFAFHHAVFDVYMEGLKEYNPVKITGRESSKEKDNAVEKFMSDETNLCLISLRAAAGLNLQKANCVVFGELDWSPAIHSQAEDRAHRMGQKDSVLCYYLVSSTGTDEDIQEALGLKVSQFIGLMGDKAESEEDRMMNQVAAQEHMTRIVDRLKNWEVK